MWAGGPKRRPWVTVLAPGWPGAVYRFPPQGFCVNRGFAVGAGDGSGGDAVVALVQEAGVPLDPAWIVPEDGEGSQRLGLVGHQDARRLPPRWSTP